ncbi:25253_t:CDS:2 [Dentiscutata erythropus]|uniref:25253_t:CDS:1 n=1 Tax=Dentiscutata erythropus TaxID=1348616 RepID=A0A9N9N856_9GLOM|nr:25253_t:CDS:2 [Dentiscutata erythropus]
MSSEDRLETIVDICRKTTLSKSEQLNLSVHDFESFIQVEIFKEIDHRSVEQSILR